MAMCKHCGLNEGTNAKGCCSMSCSIKHGFLQGRKPSVVKYTSFAVLESLLKEVNCVFDEPPKEQYKTSDKIQVKCLVCNGISKRQVRNIHSKHQCRCQGNLGIRKYSEETFRAKLALQNPLASLEGEYYDASHHALFRCNQNSIHTWKAKGYTVLAGHGCPYCGITKSSYEEKIKDLLDSFGVTYIRRSKTIVPGRELDFYIPSLKLAIEVNGLFWHSHGLKASGDEKEMREKHLYKLNLCEKQGIYLIQFDSEQIDKNWDSVVSILQHKLAKTKNVIGARKCDINQLESKAVQEFLNVNHIQGYHPAKISYAASIGSEIVACMTFSKSRYSNHQWEMIRFAVKGGLSVPGIASRLFKRFRDSHMISNDICVTYGDRMFVGLHSNVYQNLGFTLEKITRPGYHYIYKSSKLNRLKFQKHKLSKILPNFDPQKTEKQNMLENKYRIYWDCGQLVYTYRKP